MLSYSTHLIANIHLILALTLALQGFQEAFQNSVLHLGKQRCVLLSRY